MKNLIFVALATLSFSAFAETQEICNLHIYKTEVLKLNDGQTIKAKRINPDIIQLQVTSFPQDLIILNDADGDVLSYIHPMNPERSEFEELRGQKDISEKDLSVRVIKRHIYSSVYLNIVSDKLSLDVPLVANQKTRLNIPLAKDVFLNCEN